MFKVILTIYDFCLICWLYAEAFAGKWHRTKRFRLGEKRRLERREPRRLPGRVKGCLPGYWTIWGQGRWDGSKATRNECQILWWNCFLYLCYLNYYSNPLDMETKVTSVQMTCLVSQSWQMVERTSKPRSFSLYKVQGLPTIGGFLMG